MTIVEGTILGIGILSGCSLGLFGARKLQIRGMKNRIEQKVKDRWAEAEITWQDKNQVFDVMVETETGVYLIKIIRMNPLHELIITNPKSWCINPHPREWRRQSKPNRVWGVESFLECQPNSQKFIQKIALIYPNCHNISRYLNESDVELVTMKHTVNQIRFVRFQELMDVFDFIEKK